MTLWKLAVTSFVSLAGFTALSTLEDPGNLYGLQISEGGRDRNVQKCTVGLSSILISAPTSLYYNT